MCEWCVVDYCLIGWVEDGRVEKFVRRYRGRRDDER